MDTVCIHGNGVNCITCSELYTGRLNKKRFLVPCSPNGVAITADVSFKKKKNTTLFMRDIGTNEHFKVVSAGSGRERLLPMPQLPPGRVRMDWRGVNGYMFARRLVDFLTPRGCHVLWDSAGNTEMAEEVWLARKPTANSQVTIRCSVHQHPVQACISLKCLRQGREMPCCLSMVGSESVGKVTKKMKNIGRRATKPRLLLDEEPNNMQCDILNGTVTDAVYPSEDGNWMRDCMRATGERERADHPKTYQPARASIGSFSSSSDDDDDGDGDYTKQCSALPTRKRLINGWVKKRRRQKRKDSHGVGGDRTAKDGGQDEDETRTMTEPNNYLGP